MNKSRQHSTYRKTFFFADKVVVSTRKYKMMTAIEIVDNLVLKNLFVNRMPCFRPVHTYTMSLAIKKNKETKPSYAGVKDILLHK